MAARRRGCPLAGDPDPAGRRARRDRDPAPVGRDPRAGQPLLRLARGRAHRHPPGTAKGPRQAEGGAGANRRGDGTGVTTPARHRRRRPAWGAGPSGRGDQAGVTGRAIATMAPFKLASRRIGSNHEDPVVNITRRKFLEGTAALALIGGAMALVGEAMILPAQAQTVPMDELMAPGPLPDQVLGAAEAPVVIVEYASMTCPHCADFHTKTFPELKKRFIDTGKVRFIFREFPLDPLAAAGSMLARCAGEGKFFPLIDALFAQQKDWVVQKPLVPMLAIAKQAGFTQETFDKCLANQQMLDGIEATRQRAANKFNVNS